MAPPQVTLRQRDVRYADGTLHYEVTATVTDRGTLPYRELFVLQINDPLNPKSDVLARIADPRDLREDGGAIYARVDSTDLITISSDPFVRIANIDELTAMPRDRVLAVHRGLTTYLASSVSKIYDAMTTANAAGRQIIDRLSKLTTDYAVFLAEFAMMPGTVYSLPVSSRSVEAVYTAAFVSKRDARVAAEAAQAAARLARDACRADDAVLSARIDIYVADVAALEAAKTVVTTTTEASSPVTAGVTGTTNVKTFVLNAADDRSYEALLLAKRAALVAARDALAARSASCDALARALAEADAAVIAARAAETNSLRDVYAVCPTFNPNTV